MMKTIGTLLSLFMVLTLTYSCQTKSQKKASHGSVLATVNQEEIHEKELKRQSMIKAHSLKDISDETEKKKVLLNDLIDDEVLFQEAIKEDFHRKESIKRQIVRHFLNEKMRTKFKPSDEELQKYYEAHKDELQRIRASHILIKPEKKNDPESEAKALDKIEAIQKKIKAGEDFAELAKTYSQDPGSARRGGDLRFFNKRMMVKPFSDAAFALKNVGDVSDIVKTDFGYHIIKLTGRQEGIDSIKHVIKASLMKEKREEARKEIISSLRGKASVHIYDSNLEKVTLEPKKPPQKHGQAKKLDKKKLKELMKRMSPKKAMKEQSKK